MKEVSIFIVTSTRTPGKTRKSWYRYILVCDGHTLEKKEQSLNTTGHRLVLECAVAALKRMTRPAMITFWTDCHYFADGQRQLAGWKENGWKKEQRTSIKEPGFMAAVGDVAETSCCTVSHCIHGALQKF